jgi:ribosome maturation factor RimP
LRLLCKWIALDRGRQSPVFLPMISPEHIRQLASEKLGETGSYLVDVQVSPANRIRVIIDNFRGVSIEECVRVSRMIEAGLDRETEDFELEVTSPGLDQPFRVPKQYEKNIGREVELKMNDGTRLTGRLVEFSGEELTLEQETREKTEGRKGRQTVIRRQAVPLRDIRETRIVIKF